MNFRNGLIALGVAIGALACGGPAPAPARDIEQAPSALANNGGGPRNGCVDWCIAGHNNCLAFHVCNNPSQYNWASCSDCLYDFLGCSTQCQTLPRLF